MSEAIEPRVDVEENELRIDTLKAGRFDLVDFVDYIELSVLGLTFYEN